MGHTEPTGEGQFFPIVLLANSIHPGLPTHASAHASAWGSAWANWLAYNMGMVRLLWSRQILNSAVNVIKTNFQNLHLVVCCCINIIYIENQTGSTLSYISQCKGKQLLKCKWLMLMLNFV